MALVPVVAVPVVGLTVAAMEAVAEGFDTAGVSSPPPHPPAVIKAPNKAAKLNIFNDLFIRNASLFFKHLPGEFPMPYAS